MPRDARVGIAVSGGPDSLALLLLANEARPGSIVAATVDHGLRVESRAEAEFVAGVCAELGIPHSILTVPDIERPESNLQAWAREVRYALLGGWAVERSIAAVATAHHLDDQAETLLMRVARGSGIGGLAGVQPLRLLNDCVALVRPVLGWRRADLRRVVDDAGIGAVDDPSNSDERFDRSRARTLLETSDFLDPRRLAAVASHVAEAEEALAWIAKREFDARSSGDKSLFTLDAAGLPRELRRRLLVQAIAVMTGETLPGPKLAAALDVLEAGGTTTLAGLKLEGCAPWRLSLAPPRRR